MWKKLHFQIEYMCVHVLIIIFMFKCVCVCGVVVVSSFFKQLS